MSENRSRSGLGLGSILFLIFLTLKLAEIGPVKNWSWWLVTAPLWGPMVVVGVFFIIMGIIALLSNEK
jgi:hypothetical protein